MAKAGMTPRDIKIAVWMTGTNLTELALKHGYSESYCRMALLYSTCPGSEQLIIDQLGLHPHTIWPDRYDENGHRIAGRERADTTKSKCDGHRQKNAAA